VKLNLLLTLHFINRCKTLYSVKTCAMDKIFPEIKIDLI